MASIESSDPQKSNGKSESSVRLIPLSSELGFDWSLFDLYLKQHVSQWPNGTLCLTTDLDKVDLDESTSDEDKATREKKLRSANSKVVSALFNASFNCDEAKAVLTSHSQLDPTGNAFKLYNMIKVRFSRKNEDKLQSMINDLMAITAQAGEEPTVLVDRMEKMCVAISAIDGAQLPMEFALVGALKKAVKSRFKLLTSGIKLAPTEWTLPLLKIKLRD